MRTALSAKKAADSWSQIENWPVLRQFGQSGGGPVPEPFGCPCENVKIVENLCRAVRIVTNQCISFSRASLAGLFGVDVGVVLF